MSSGSATLIVRDGQGSASKRPFICIFYSKTDLAVVRRIEETIKALGVRAWYADRDAKKHWRREVRSQLEHDQYIGTIVLWSKASIANDTVSDEVEDAKNREKPVLAVFLQECQAPVGLRMFPRYPATGALRSTSNGYAELHARISEVFSTTEHAAPAENDHKGSEDAQIATRLRSHVRFGRASLLRPAFMFSISSFETQISPRSAISLIAATIPPKIVLVSAFDLARKENDDLRVSKADLDRLAVAGCTIVIDSGNYEAHRFDQDNKKKTSASIWKSSPKTFHAELKKSRFDFAFTHDKSIKTNGSDPLDVASMTTAVLDEFHRDNGVCRDRVIPIVHAAKTPAGEYESDLVLQVIANLARETKIHAIAVAERELGDGVLGRAKNVRKIRRLLDNSGRSIGLHILGAGNPLSCACFALAGADSFDGLEWCRTVADWDMRLSHFQHLPFARNHPRTVANDKISAILESNAIPGRIKTIAWNLYHFNQFAQELTRQADNPEAVFHSYNWKTELELLRTALSEVD
jgi:hypothetical protein